MKKLLLLIGLILLSTTSAFGTETCQTTTWGTTTEDFIHLWEYTYPAIEPCCCVIGGCYAFRYLGYYNTSTSPPGRDLKSDECIVGGVTGYCHDAGLLTTYSEGPCCNLPQEYWSEYSWDSTEEYLYIAKFGPGDKG